MEKVLRRVLIKLAVRVTNFCNFFIHGLVNYRLLVGFGYRARIFLFNIKPSIEKGMKTVYEKIYMFEKANNVKTMKIPYGSLDGFGRCVIALFIMAANKLYQFISLGATKWCIQVFHDILIDLSMI